LKKLVAGKPRLHILFDQLHTYWNILLDWVIIQWSRCFLVEFPYTLLMPPWKGCLILHQLLLQASR
jgi:hypothetical protein